MGTWALIQVVFDIFAALGFFVIVMRMSRAPKDDPRLSRGLQLLQSKIAVIEDLSDRTEVQVNQLAALLDQKGKEVQAKIQLAESSVREIKILMQNSLEVAKIFQDKIPHQEIIERQNSIKYVQAARLAHQGLSADEIAAKVDLPKGEIEFIAKVNREQLMFNEDNLPEWAKQNGAEMADQSNLESLSNAQTSIPNSGQIDQTSPVEASDAGSASLMPGGGALGHLNFIEASEAQAARFRAEIEIAERQRLVENLSKLQFEMQNLDMQLAREASSRNLSGVFEGPKLNGDSLQKVGAEFRKAVEAAKETRQALPPLDQLSALIPQIFSHEPSAVSQSTPPVVAEPKPKPAQPIHLVSARPGQSSPPVVRKVVFPRIESTEV